MDENGRYKFDNENARRQALKIHGYISENESSSDESSVDDFERKYGHLRPTFDISNRKITVLVSDDETSEENATPNYLKNDKRIRDNLLDKPDQSSSELNEDKIYYILRKQVYLKTLYESIMETKKKNLCIEKMDREKLTKVFAENFPVIIENNKYIDLQIIEKANEVIENQIKLKCFSKKEVNFVEKSISEFLSNEKIKSTKDKVSSPPKEKIQKKHSDTSVFNDNEIIICFTRNNNIRQEQKIEENNNKEKTDPHTSSQKQTVVNKTEKIGPAKPQNEIDQNKIDRYTLNNVFIQTFGPQKRQFQKEFQFMSKMDQDEARRKFLRNLSQAINENITPKDIVQSLSDENLQFVIEKTIYEMFSAENVQNETPTLIEKWSLKNKIDQHFIELVILNHFGKNLQDVINRFKHSTVAERENLKNRFLKMLSNKIRKHYRLPASKFPNVTRDEILDWLLTQNLNEFGQTIFDIFSYETNIRISISTQKNLDQPKSIENKNLVSDQNQSICMNAKIDSVKIQNLRDKINQPLLRRVFAQTFGKVDPFVILNDFYYYKNEQEDYKTDFLTNLSKTIRKNYYFDNSNYVSDITQEELFQIISEQNLNRCGRVIYKMFTPEINQNCKPEALPKSHTIPTQNQEIRCKNKEFEKESDVKSLKDKIDQSIIKKVFVYNYGQNLHPFLKYYQDLSTEHEMEFKNYFLRSLSKFIRKSYNLESIAYPNITPDELIEILSTQKLNRFGRVIFDIFSPSKQCSNKLDSTERKDFCQKILVTNQKLNNISTNENIPFRENKIQVTNNKNSKIKLNVDTNKENLRFLQNSNNNVEKNSEKISNILQEHKINAESTQNERNLLNSDQFEKIAGVWVENAGIKQEIVLCLDQEIDVNEMTQSSMTSILQDECDKTETVVKENRLQDNKRQEEIVNTKKNIKFKIMRTLSDENEAAKIGCCIVL